MKGFFFLVVLLCSLVVKGQKEVLTSEQTWMGLLQQVRLNEKWGVITEAHFRTADNWVRGNNLWLLRAGASYFINDRSQLTAGYAYFHYFPAEAHQYTGRPEHRLWQQWLWVTNHSKLRVQHRLRLEERWRRHINTVGAAAPGYNFNWRARAQLQLLYPLGKRAFAPGTVALMLSDEAMLNFGKEIVYNRFDQNRVIAGLQVQVGQNDFLQAGYMHIFQQQPSGNKYRQSHVARIFYTHGIDWRTKKPKVSRSG